jgi:hypothetical protein
VKGRRMDYSYWWLSGKYNPNIKGEMASNLPNYSFVAIRIF